MRFCYKGGKDTMLGSMLKERDQQYVAMKDGVTNTWRILDTWHDDLKTLQVEDDVPDESSAVTILTEGEFIALIGLNGAGKTTLFDIIIGLKKSDNGKILYKFSKYL